MTDEQLEKVAGGTADAGNCGVISADVNTWVENDIDEYGLCMMISCIP